MTTACYAAWIRDADVLRRSTSGGLFTALARRTLARGGLVVGAAYGDGLRVAHRVAATEAELDALRGVKYAQGAVSREVVEAVRTALGQSRDVLFSGLPCQCAALRRLFGADAHLLLVDLICFGAPPSALWEKYVAWREASRGKRLRAVSPRDKANGWGRRTFYRYDWADGTTTRRLSTYDPYAILFYTTLGFRACCFRCPFRGLDRPSDITLGDGWGLEHLNPGRGVSAVLVHSPRGQAAFAEIREDIVCRAVTAAELVRENPALVRSPDEPPEAAAFRADAARLPFAALVRAYRLQRTPLTVWARRLRARLGSLLRKAVGQ